MSSTLSKETIARDIREVIDTEVGSTSSDPSSSVFLPHCHLCPLADLCFDDFFKDGGVCASRGMAARFLRHRAWSTMLF